MTKLQRLRRSSRDSLAWYRKCAHVYDRHNICATGVPVRRWRVWSRRTDERLRTARWAETDPVALARLA